MKERGPTVYKVDQQRLRIRDLPARLRPREEFERVGAQNVSDAVLLALILRTGTQRMNVSDLARCLLTRFGSLTALAKATVQELQGLDGIGPVKAQMVQAAMELAQRLTRESVGTHPVVTNPGQAAAVLRERARTLDHEVLWMLLLNTRNELIGEPQQISEGTFNSSPVDTRVIFKKALAHSCNALILAHNHPSGDPTPSKEDVKVTKQLIEAGRIMDTLVIDHVIIGKRRSGQEEDYVSLRETGLVKFE